jgi:hypothetical protein
MKPILRWLLIMLGVTLGPLPAQAQFLGLNRVYFGPYASSPYRTWRAAPLAQSYGVPLVYVRQPVAVDAWRQPVVSAPTKASDIRVNSDLAGTRNVAITSALAESKQWFKPESVPQAGRFVVKVNQPVVLRVGSNADSPYGKEDLSDVLDRAQVVWDYPPETQFRKIHEDTSKAVLVLSPKLAGTFTVAAVVVDPVKEKPPELKKDEKKDRAPPIPQPPGKLFKRLVTFTIQVDGSTTPPISPETEPRPTSVAEALQRIKAAAETEKSAAAMTNLRLRISNFASDRMADYTLLKDIINAAARSNQLPNTVPAINQLLDLAGAPTMSQAQLKALVSDIHQNLQ